VQQILRLLAEPTRLRILAAVDEEELAVNEIADVLGMSPSRISNHLRLLKDGGALSDRREGAWTFYKNALREAPGEAALWLAVVDGARDDALLRSDAARRRTVLERRRQRSRDHFAAGQNGDALGLERGILREEILASLLPRSWVAVDVGCGDGFLTESLAERFDRVVAIDHSPERLRAARAAVKMTNVTFRTGEVDALPLLDGEADVLFLSMVLHHVPEIGAALREAHRVLRPGGRVIVADLTPHAEEAMRKRMGDLKLGLQPRAICDALKGAGFQAARVLPARDRLVVGRHKTLDLFLATAERPREPKSKRRSKA
jgi:ArsR family transcriptional regulator